MVSLVYAAFFKPDVGSCLLFLAVFNGVIGLGAVVTTSLMPTSAAVPISAREKAGMDGAMLAQVVLVG